MDENQPFSPQHLAQHRTNTHNNNGIKLVFIASKQWNEWIKSTRGKYSIWTRLLSLNSTCYHTTRFLYSSSFFFHERIIKIEYTYYTYSHKKKLNLHNVKKIVFVWLRVNNWKLNKLVNQNLMNLKVLN